MEQSRCKTCFLREQAEADHTETIRLYVSNLDAEMKVDPGEYARRLEKCGRCGDMSQGVCMQCGCFVEMRAAVNIRHCPKGEKCW